MKKVLLAVFAVAVVIASCSKEKKLNKKLDGEWNATMVGGQALPSGYSMVIKFEKDKKEGTYTTTFSDGTTSDVSTGTYTLEKDEKMYLLDSSAGSTKDTMVVVEYSKTKLVLSDVAGTADSKIELAKK